MNKKVLVIGGGISGIGAALSLASQNIDVTLVEKESTIGGHTASFVCKATEACQQCSVCVLSEKVKAVYGNPRISLLVRTMLKSIEGPEGNFKIRLKRFPRLVNEAKCNSCGLCKEACLVDPEPAIGLPEGTKIPRTFGIDEKKCIRYSGGSCNSCQLKCPTGAIDLCAQESEVTVNAGAIIVATGYQPFDAREKPRLGYGRFSAVMTGLDIEKALLKAGSTAILPGGKKPRSVAFVQCVGSRDAKIGNGYCSRVCCKYALRLARLIQYNEPGTKVSIYYMDIQAGGKDFGTIYRDCQKNVDFIRGVVVEVEPSSNGGLKVRYEDIANTRISEGDHDLVVLSVGMMHQKGQKDLASLLEINIDEFGFFATRDAFSSNKTNRQGVLVAGSAVGPRNITESLAHGEQAASEALNVLRGSELYV